MKICAACNAFIRAIRRYVLKRPHRDPVYFCTMACYDSYLEDQQ